MSIFLKKKKSNYYDSIISDIKAVDFSSCADEELMALSQQLMTKISDGISEDDLIVEAFSIVSEAMYRTLGYRPYDVQISAGLALHKGKLIEMKTGEGKTLSAVFPAYLNALCKKGVHILTYNDYLARRDAEWMGPIFINLGLSVGFIQEGMSKNKRQEAYNADITYATAKESGFDYLRDCISYSLDDFVHRPFHYAIVDEADSIMIDEARIPLVIATKDKNKNDDYAEAFEIISNLNFGQDYQTDENSKNVFLTDAGTEKVETLLGSENLYDAENFDILSKMNYALCATTLLKKDIDYIVNNEKVELVDEFTGRIAEKRHWPDGLQAAVNAKEGLNSEVKGKITNSIAMQNFISLYPKISGMSGTALTSSNEFMDIYALDTVAIPTNKPCIREDSSDIVFDTKNAKYSALVNDIADINSTGRPILVGTSDITESELIANMLKENNIKCEVLNAKSDKHEAEIIANAGALNAVTVSTNMAGRGTDIKLGGFDERDKDKVKKLGGLHVIGTNKHESVRIDNQLRGRAGRQGDPGSTRFYISLEDELFTPQAQRIVENQNYEIRKTLYKYSNIVEAQRIKTFAKRKSILENASNADLIKKIDLSCYELLVKKVDYETLANIERDVTIYYIDKCWADFLEQITIIQDSIHLTRIAGENPLDEYVFEVSRLCDCLRTELQTLIIEKVKEIMLNEGNFSQAKEIKGPSATWTYLLTDNPFEDNLGLMLASKQNIGFAAFVGSSFMSPIAIFIMIIQRMRNMKHLS